MQVCFSVCVYQSRLNNIIGLGFLMGLQEVTYLPISLEYLNRVPYDESLFFFT